MTSLFDKDVALQAVLYILDKMGGKCDMHKICKILYFADQKHLSRYSRSITGDDYIAMQYGPVPSKVDDMMKAVRGDSFFSNTEYAAKLRNHFSFLNKFIVVASEKPDTDYLSETDIECLDEAISICGGMNFGELTGFSHGPAWQNTKEGRTMSVKDILREAGDEEGYVNYVAAKLKLESCSL